MQEALLRGSTLICNFLGFGFTCDRTFAEYYLNALTKCVLSVSFSSVTLVTPKVIKFKSIVAYLFKKVKTKIYL